MCALFLQADGQWSQMNIYYMPLSIQSALCGFHLLTFPWTDKVSADSYVGESDFWVLTNLSLGDEAIGTWLSCATAGKELNGSTSPSLYTTSC